MLSKPMTFTAADTLDADDTITISIANLQKYIQHFTFTVALEQVTVTPSVTIKAYGRVTSTADWTQIGSTITWTTTANNGSITSTTPYNYNYLKVEFVASAASQKSKITAFEVKTSNCFDIPVSSGTLTISRATSGTVTIQTADDDANAAAVYRAGGTGALTIGASTGSTTLTSSGTVAITASNVEIGTTSANETTPSLVIQGDADSDAGGDTDEALTIDLIANATPTSAYWKLTSTQSAGIAIAGSLGHAIAGGTPVMSAGLLGGAGTSTSATQTLGAAGGKAFSYYLSSTSTTASHILQGYYMNVNYGTSGTSAAPSGDVIRGRAYLVGDASGGTALTGGAFSVELAATTASNTGLTAGLRGNLVLPDGVLTNSGTFYGTMAEVFLGGAAVNTTAYTEIAPLGIVIGGTAPTAASQLANMVAIAVQVPANEVTSDGTIVVTGGAGDTCDAKLKISINGTNYWIMLSTDDE
jgi:hypothetical protein